MPPALLSLVGPTISASLQTWLNKKKESKDERERKQDAVAKLLNAARATKAYLHDRKTNGPSRDREAELSNLWGIASNAMLYYDETLYMSAHLKSMGWADPNEWEAARLVPEMIRLEGIIDQCAALHEQLLNE